MSDEAFAAAVEALLDGWLTGPGATTAFSAADGTLMSLADPWLDAAWRARLSERGWLAPGWAPQYGGSGWTPARQLHWYRACGRRFPGYREPAAIAWLGPLLQAADPARAAIWAPAILEDCLGWACALMEPGPGWAAGDFAASAKRSPGGTVCLNGRKLWVMGIDRASHLALVSAHGLTLLAMDRLRAAAGFTAVPLETLDRLAGFWSVTFEDCVVEPLAHVPLGDGLLGTAGELAAGAGRWGAGSCLRGALAVAWQLEAMPETAARELEVALAAIEAMEDRYAAADFVAAPGFLSPAQRLAHQEGRLRSQLEALITDALGYDALPLVDEVRAHNEGPLGSVNAARARKALAELRLTGAWRRGRVDGGDGAYGRTESPGPNQHTDRRA